MTNHQRQHRARLHTVAILREFQDARYRTHAAKLGLCAAPHPERMNRIYNRMIRQSCLISSGRTLMDAVNGELN